MHLRDKTSILESFRTGRSRKSNERNNWIDFRF